MTRGKRLIILAITLDKQCWACQDSDWTVNNISISTYYSSSMQIYSHEETNVTQMSHFWNVPSHFLSSLFSVLFFSGCQRTHIDMYLNQMHRHDVKKVYYFQKDTLKSQIFIRRVYLNELTTTCSNLPSIGVQLLLLLLTSFSAKN